MPILWRYPPESLLPIPVQSVSDRPRGLIGAFTESPPISIPVTCLDWQRWEVTQESQKRFHTVKSWNHERWNMIQALPVTSDPVTWPCDCLHFSSVTASAPPLAHLTSGIARLGRRKVVKNIGDCSTVGNWLNWFRQQRDKISIEQTFFVVPLF